MCNSQGLALLPKSGVRSSILASHVRGRALSIGVIVHCLLWCLRGSSPEAEWLGHQWHTDMGHKRRFNSLHFIAFLLYISLLANGIERCFLYVLNTYISPLIKPPFVFFLSQNSAWIVILLLNFWSSYIINTIVLWIFHLKMFCPPLDCMYFYLVIFFHRTYMFKFWWGIVHLIFPLMQHGLRVTCGKTAQP